MTASKRLGGLVAILALAAGMAAAPAHGQDLAATPTVAVRPVGTTADDPNAGQWFVATLTPGGQAARLTAQLTNLGRVDQKVKLYLADMDFGPDGAPIVLDSERDIAAWGSVDRSSVVVPARRSVRVSFTLRAPRDADAGDHVGAFVVENEPIVRPGEPIGLVKRVATRLYATVPGDARQDISIESVSATKDSAIYPREATVEVNLRNTGGIRLSPTVLVNGRRAEGPQIVLSRSVERYVVNLPIPVYGGPQGYRVEVSTRAVTATGIPGPARQTRASMFVIPWHLLILIVLAAAGVWAGRRWWARRVSRYASMQADMRRIERMLSARLGNGDGDGRADHDDPRAAIDAMVKQARRRGDGATATRLEAAMDGGPGRAVTSDDDGFEETRFGPPAPEPATRPREAKAPARTRATGKPRSGASRSRP